MQGGGAAYRSSPLDGCGLYQMRRPEFAKAPMSRNTLITMVV